MRRLVVVLAFLIFLLDSLIRLSPNNSINFVEVEGEAMSDMLFTLVEQRSRFGANPMRACL